MTGPPAPPQRPPLPLSARLRFDWFVATDAPFIVALLNEPGFLRFIGDRGVRTADDAVRYLQEGPMAMYARHGFGLWRLTLRDNGAAVGMCGLLQREGLEHPDLGFAMLRKYEGLGLATEAGRAVVEHAAGHLGLPSLHAIVDPDNAASLRVLERLGFRDDGLVRLGGIGNEIRLLTRG